ncbi:MAG: DUF4350 domain-containing protein [Pseudomonadota bacterium]
MSEATASAPTSGAGDGGVAAPFTRPTLLAMVLVGCLAFLAMLYSLGAGNPLSNQDGDSGHAASKSLIGYHGLVDLLRDTGADVSLSRTPAAAGDYSLLVVTPDFRADWEEVGGLISRHRFNGPTLVILPKWIVMRDRQLERGWVRLVDTLEQQITNDEIGFTTTISQADSRNRRLMTGLGAVPKTPEKLATFDSDDVHPMVSDARTGKPVIGYVDDTYGFDWLNTLQPHAPPPSGSDPEEYEYYDAWPVVLVADPDLFNNMGLAEQETALHALRLFEALDRDDDLPIVFDLTANGLGRADNLLTLAFRPPFLAATICFLVAAFMVGWVAFTRFAPPMLAARVIDFGKETLVSNSAATMRLLRREHLLREPYANLIRRMAIRRLGLPPTMDADAITARLDAETPDDVMPYSVRRDRLLAARKPKDIAVAAAELHAWKKDYL